MGKWKEEREVKDNIKAAAQKKEQRVDVKVHRFRLRWLSNVRNRKKG